MISNLCFLVVNITLLLILIKIDRRKGSIDGMFLICLIFTFFGNVTIKMTLNTYIALINTLSGIMLYRKTN